MSIDIDKMVRMAGERRHWRVKEFDMTRVDKRKPIGTTSAAHEFAPTLEEKMTDARFIAQAPATILYLSERVAALEAENAAHIAHIREIT